MSAPFIQFAKITIQNPLPQTPDNLVANILNLVFGVLGGISLIVVAWAGLKYTLSAGDPSKTAEAKNQIMYAAIGIVVSISAVSIIQFAVSQL